MWEEDKRKIVQPFSVGPRNCIGRNLAMAEMRVLLARLMWGFEMVLDERSAEWGRGQDIFLVYDKPSLWVRLKPVVRG